MTKRQAEALAFIEGFIAENGYSPSYREIMKALGLRSSESAHRLVTALADRGKITYQRGRKRSIELLPKAA